MSDDYDDDMPQMTHKAPNEEAPSGALPQAPENTNVDPMGEVMRAVGASAPDLARIATRYGITEGDPAWTLALAVRDATAAGAVADQAAGRIASLIDKNHRPTGWMILDQSSVFRWYGLMVQAMAPIFGGE